MMSAKMLKSTKEAKLSKFDKWYNKHILPLLNKLDAIYGKLLNGVVRKEV